MRLYKNHSRGHKDFLDILDNKFSNIDNLTEEK